MIVTKQESFQAVFKPFTASCMHSSKSRRFPLGTPPIMHGLHVHSQKTSGCIVGTVRIG